MFKLFVVLFTLNSALVCKSLIINDYNQPIATSYVARRDEPVPENADRYGFSEKYGYNKMIITTYLAPVPEEVAASYSTYIIHPMDNKRCGYATADDRPNQDSYPKATEDNVNFLKRFPIVVEDSDSVDESEKIDEAESVPKIDEDIINILKNNKVIADGNEDGNSYRGWFWRKEEPNINDEDKDQYVRSYGEWYAQEEPKHLKLIEDAIKKEFGEWFAKKEPKATEAVDWKNLKNKFDSLYEEKYKEHFGDDDEDDDDEDDEDEDDEEDDEKVWYNKVPYEYEYEDENDVDENKGKYNDLNGPKYDYKDYDYGYRLRPKW